MRALLEITDKAEDDARRYGMTDAEMQDLMKQLEDQMLAAAGDLDFEKAAKLRDKLFELKGNKPVDKPQPQHRRRREHLKHGK